MRVRVKSGTLNTTIEAPSQYDAILRALEEAPIETELGQFIATKREGDHCDWWLTEKMVKHQAM